MVWLFPTALKLTTSVRWLLILCKSSIVIITMTIVPIPSCSLIHRAVKDEAGYPLGNISNSCDKLIRI